jgi:GxxExxY protein
MDPAGSELIHEHITSAILKCAIEVHRELGPGLLESAYRRCLRQALQAENLVTEEEAPISVGFRGQLIAGAYRADLIVEKKVLVEVKSVEAILSVHIAQVRTYLKFLDLRVGLLLNFNVAQLCQGIRRLAP